MTHTLPAIRGKFGSTSYYVITMKASTVIEKIRMPSELPGWETMSIEEKFQRELNYKRVKNHIAPYLVNDDDRFFGALIVDMYNADGVEFETLEEAVPKLPGLYKGTARLFGFLHLTGGEIFVPLDGQHRVTAIEFAITGKDQKGKTIEGLKPSTEVGNDDVTVILLEHDDAKARKIFNKVNRYAKPTTKAENLITADDDVVAVITRAIAMQLFATRLVNIKSNTLNKGAVEFTTLSTLYEANLKIIENTIGSKVSTVILPSKADQALYETEVASVWDHLLNGISLFSAALSDKDDTGDAKRIEIRAETLLGKPVAQLSLVGAFLRLRDADLPDGGKMPTDEIIRRLNAIDWGTKSPVWQRVLMSGDNVMSGKTTSEFAARFIAYLAGEHLSTDDIGALLDTYKTRFPLEDQTKVKLPPRVS